MTFAGTGKTYASAFAMRELDFKKVLFVVHRNQIAKQTLKSFRKVFSGKVSVGQVTGKHQDYDADYIFATVQTISKDETLKLYARDHFDAIVIDEAHHSAANSYKKVMDYFNPKLWLGMTATRKIKGVRYRKIKGVRYMEFFLNKVKVLLKLDKFEFMVPVPIYNVSLMKVTRIWFIKSGTHKIVICADVLAVYLKKQIKME